MNWIGSRTKKAEVISYILKTCGIEAKEAIMIGDRRHDIEGGKACGLESVEFFMVMEQSRN